MDMTPQGLAVVRYFEGRALKAYKDSVGVVTIGYGNTNYDSFAVAYLGGKIVMGMTITEEQAEYLLTETMARNYMPAVSKAMGDGKPNEGDAGGSFHYNTGAISRAGWVTLWKNKANPVNIRASLSSWNKAGGRALAGLTTRRAAEGLILTNGDYGIAGRTKPAVLSGPLGLAVPAVAPTHALVNTAGMLRLDDKNPHVQDLNDSLALIGFADCKGDVFSLATQAAVISIQKAHSGLDVDGIVGPATRAVIGRETDLKKKSKVVGGVIAGGLVPATAVQTLTESGIPGSVWIAAAVLAVIAIGWVAFKYSDEITALAKRNAA